MDEPIEKVLQTQIDDLRNKLNQLERKFNAHRDREEIHYKVNIIGGKE